MSLNIRRPKTGKPPGTACEGQEREVYDDPTSRSINFGLAFFGRFEWTDSDANKRTLKWKRGEESVMHARLVTVALVLFAAESRGQSGVKEAKFVRRFESHSQTWEHIQSVEFSSDGLRLVSAATDDTVRIWDVESGKEIRRFALQRNENHVCATFSPDGHLIASRCHDGSIKLWDAKTGEKIHDLKGHIDIVNCVTFSSDGHRVASGGWDRTVRLWDVESGKEVQRYEQYMEVVNSVAFLPDGNYIVCNGVDRTVLFWDAIHPFGVTGLRQPSRRRFRDGAAT
jgi:WD40 repeat protein